MRGLNEKMTRSSSVVTRHDRRGSCVVMTACGPASSPTAAAVRCCLMFFADVLRRFCNRYSLFLMAPVTHCQNYTPSNGLKLMLCEQ